MYAKVNVVGIVMIMTMMLEVIRDDLGLNPMNEDNDCINGVVG
jgi:hypothetical protein